MSPIPEKLREELANDPYYQVCARHKDGDCEGRITWEHAWIYAGKQIQERWSILPLCVYHHLGAGLEKPKNQYISLIRATRTDLAKYPNKNWKEELRRLELFYKEEKRRTIQQNRAIHLYCTQVAEALNAAGLDMKKVLKPGVDIDWTGISVKEYLVKPVLKVKTNKKSTTKMDTMDINGVYDVLNRFLSEKFKIHISFPSEETLAIKAGEIIENYSKK